MEVPLLSLPRLESARFRGRRCGQDFELRMITDEDLAACCGVRIAFTDRHGGVSEGVWSQLDLALHVGDDAEAVYENRARVLDALGAADVQLVDPFQVHGSDLVFVDDAAPLALDTAQVRAHAGADGVVVTVADVAALLCFADCMPVAIVSPSGAFALVHAGWRGVLSSIAVSAARALAARESTSSSPLFDDEACALASYNVYIGPYIHAECFEVHDDVYDRLVALGGPACALDECHVDLGRVVTADLVRAGISKKRIADADVCTACNVESYYSYRGEGGACGRHGAIVFRKV